MTQLVTDIELSENAAYALHFASQLINVAVESGWVTITGAVADEADKEAAEKAVLYIRGVKGIRNYISIIRPPEPEATTRFIEAVPTPQVN